MLRSVRTKIIAAFVIALAAIVAIVSVAGMVYIRWYEHRLSDQMGVSAAIMCADIAGYIIDDPDLSNPNSKAYQDYRQLLRDVCREKNMDYLSVFKCDVEAKTITYIFCVADDDVNDERVARERGFGTVVEVEMPETMRRAMNGEKVYEADEIDNQFGNMLAWYSQVPGNDQTILASAEYSVTEQRARVFESAVDVLVPLVLGLLVLLMVQMYVLNRRVFKPLQTITERMRSFSADRASEFEPLEIESNDEMGAIADAFENMAADIGSYVNDIERFTAERVQAGVELDVARRIQLGMVPERTMQESTGYELCALSRTARSVGGDFYDAFEIEGDRVGVVVGDVSGKGVAAALFMSMVKIMVHDGLKAGAGPAEALNRINDQLCSSNPEGMFVTALALVLDCATGEVRYANAGHLPPLVVGSAVHQVEVAPGVLLGLFDDAGLEEGTLALGEGEFLVAFTDGVTEAVSAEREFFGSDALVDCIAEGAPYSSASELADAIVRTVDAFAAGCEQFDDLTLVVVHRMPGELRALPVDIASFARVRDDILAKSTDDAAGRKACLACEEAFANIVSYSGATCIWYAVDANDDRLRVTLADDGAPFDPFASSPEARSFENLDAGGMGIGLIRSLSREATYTRDGNRNVLTIVF
ncbi:MAG: SpoIIE family protein phosphatase [Eggerthellaceae bacterium]|nr:SpoIIE family protein phosphatase [Eggerthellaceae bacterium]